MALFYPDILKSNNPAAFAIAMAAEIAGHRQVKDLAALYAVADCMLSASGTNTDNDALGQLFYVQSEQAFYQLISWAGRRQASGWKRMDFATLGADGKLPQEALPDVDLTLYKVVADLPQEGIEDNKIYLVANASGTSGDTYTEYVHANGQWEKLGEYRAEVDLSGYVKFTDTATQAKAGAMSAADKAKLDGVYGAAQEGVVNTFGEADGSSGDQLEINYSCHVAGDEYQFDSSSDAIVLPAATATDAGVMAAADKAKLDGIAAGAIDLEMLELALNGSGWDTVANESSVNVQPNMDGGQGATSYGGFTLPAATTSAAGVMTAADKAQMENLKSVQGGQFVNGKTASVALVILDGLIAQLQSKVSVLEAALTLKEQA